MAKDRHLHHIKAFRPTVGKGTPRKNEGSEGDFSIRVLPDGLFLFIKHGNFWYKIAKLEQASVSSSGSLRSLENDINLIGSLSKGASGNVGIKPGSRLFLDAKNSRQGIDGENYIESGNTASTASRGATDSDKAFMNFALDKEPILILSGIKGSTNTAEALTFRSTIDHQNGPLFHFVKTRSGSSGGDDNTVGVIKFSGPDKQATPVETEWAAIVAQISEADDTDEAGKLSFYVAESDGTTTALTAGLVLEGEHATDGQVDVNIGAGAASMTTIAGDLDIDGDTITTAGAISLDSGGSVTLDAHNGNFIAKKAGTQFSAANSAYAGMILGYSRIQNDGTTSGHANITISNSAFTVLQTVQGTDVKVAFTAPPSGIVEIECRLCVYAPSKGVKFSLSDNASYNEIAETHTYDADYSVYQDETDHYPVIVTFAVDGLTAGASLTYYLAAISNTTGAFIRHGRNRTSGTHYEPILMKATALPAGIFKGE